MGIDLVVVDKYGHVSAVNALPQSQVLSLFCSSSAGRSVGCQWLLEVVKAPVDLPPTPVPAEIGLGFIEVAGLEGLMQLRSRSQGGINFV